jgi:hypothetical protein
MNATIETTIDGMNIKHSGRYLKRENAVICGRGMKLTFRDGDKITFHEPQKRQTLKPVNCPLDMHQWFKKTKQIS